MVSIHELSGNYFQRLLAQFLVVTSVLALLSLGYAELEIPRSRHTDSITALLSESLKNHRAQACEGQRLSLKTTFYGRLVPSSELCPPSEKQMRKQLEKIDSNKRQLWEEKYEDTSCDVTNAHTKIVEKCQNKRKCRVHAKPHFFGRDPCPTTSKYLQISYKCKPSQFNSGYHCEDGSMHLSCRPKKRLAIYSAIYGRTVENRLPQNAHADCPSPQVVSYDCTVDVLSKLMILCHAQSKCSLPITDDHLGNPCPRDVRKYLNLIYMCVNENVFNEAALEGRLELQGSGDDEDQPVALGPNMGPVIAFSAHPDISEEKKKMNNDAAFAPEPYIPPQPKNPYEDTTPVSISLIPETCLPPSVPNAIGFLHEWIRTYTFLKENKEKLILYFFLSASTGLILLLACCICQQCRQTKTTHTPVPAQDRGTETYGSKIELDSVINTTEYITTPTVYDTESRIEMSDLGRNGVSFMHFNHPTPPRTQTLQRYYS